MYELLSLDELREDIVMNLRMTDHDAQQMVARFEAAVAERAWDAGCSRAMRRMSDEPGLPLTNPYRTGGAA